jgi:hypothetical protein
LVVDIEQLNLDVALIKEMEEMEFLRIGDIL